MIVYIPLTCLTERKHVTNTCRY